MEAFDTDAPHVFDDVQFHSSIADYSLYIHGARQSHRLEHEGLYGTICPRPRLEPCCVNHLTDANTANTANTEDLAESLVRRIGAGDRVAENELVAHFRRGLYFILRRESGDAELAQDLTQDTLEKVIRNARDGKIQKPRALAHYIRHVGVYQLIDYRRKQTRRKTSTSADIADQVPAEGLGLVEQVDSTQIAQLVRQLLDEMTVERDKEVLRRFYLIGQDKATIATEFDMTPAHFDRVKSRALLRLRKLMTENLKSRGALRGDILGVLLAAVLT